MYWGQARDRGHLGANREHAERPTEFRHLSTWFGYEDLTSFMMCCIEASEVGYLAVWGVSNNTRSYWDNSAAERIGYRPVQNAEDYAGEILARPNPLDPVTCADGSRAEASTRWITPLPKSARVGRNAVPSLLDKRIRPGSHP